MPKPLRSMLYVPAVNARALEKARGLDADALVFDLEDAVAADRKEEARTTLAAAMAAGDYGDRLTLLRINAAGTPWHDDDLAFAARLSVGGLLLPKVETPPALPGRLWCMIETPLGVLNASAIAATPGVEGLVVGTNDLNLALGARALPGRAPIAHALQAILLAARAHGVRAIDGVFAGLDDPAGFEAEAEDGRAMGYDGKSLVHPATIAIANRVFGPAQREVAAARALLTAFEAAGGGVARIDGRMVEALHAEEARRLIAMADVIAARGAKPVPEPERPSPAAGLPSPVPR